MAMSRRIVCISSLTIFVSILLSDLRPCGLFQARITAILRRCAMKPKSSIVNYWLSLHLSSPAIICLPYLPSNVLKTGTSMSWWKRSVGFGSSTITLSVVAGWAVVFLFLPTPPFVLDLKLLVLDLRSFSFGVFSSFITALRWPVPIFRHKFAKLCTLITG